MKVPHSTQYNNVQYFSSLAANILNFIDKCIGDRFRYKITGDSRKRAIHHHLTRTFLFVNLCLVGLAANSAEGIEMRRFILSGRKSYEV